MKKESKVVLGATVVAAIIFLLGLPGWFWLWGGPAAEEIVDANLNDYPIDVRWDSNFVLLTADTDLYWSPDANSDLHFDSNESIALGDDVISISDYSSTLDIYWEGGQINLEFGGDELKITGDTNKMDEAATIFFTEFIKPMADAYIRERLQTQKLLP